VQSRGFRRKLRRSLRERDAAKVLRGLARGGAMIEVMTAIWAAVAAGAAKKLFG
jgi:hypothetical protein